MERSDYGEGSSWNGITVRVVQNGEGSSWNGQIMVRVVHGTDRLR